MGYTRRDLRAADMLALVFVGFGLVLLVLGALAVTTPLRQRIAHSSQAAESGLAAEIEASKAPIKAKAMASETAVPLVAGFVCLCLGLALHLKVRQLTRTGGHEPRDYPGVPPP